MAMTSTYGDEDEVVGLLGRRSSDEDDSSTGARCCRKRDAGWFFVEPVLVVYCLCEFPVLIITQVGMCYIITQVIIPGDSVDNIAARCRLKARLSS